MDSASFEGGRGRLKDKYQAMLLESGGDARTISEQKTRENFDAIYDAGWYDGTREEAWTAVNQSGETTQTITAAYEPTLTSMSEEVEAALTMRGGSLPYPVYVGTWPIGNTNACAMSTEHGALVLVSAGMMSLTFQVAKAFVYSYDWMHDDSGYLDSTRPLSDYFGMDSYNVTPEKSIDGLVETFRAYFQEGCPTAARRQRVATPGPRRDTLSTLLHNAELFIVAHEYAHVVLEHCGPLVTYATRCGVLRDIFERDRQQEFDADALGASLVVSLCDLTGTAGNLEPNIRIAGIPLLFATLLFHDVINEGAAGLDLEPHPHSTHPTANARLVRICEYLQRFPDEFTVLAKLVVKWAVPLSIEVAERFHERRLQSGIEYPYLTGTYWPMSKAP